MSTYDQQLKKVIDSCECEYIVWYTGSKDQADYIIEYSKNLYDNAISLPLPDSAIKGKSKILSKNFLRYFFLDFPDIIISKRADLNKLPIMGIEILEQKPVGWNHTQRFPRAAASAIYGVPFAYFMPQKRYMFDEYKGKGKPENVYKIGGKLIKENLRKEFQLLFSLYKLSDIHQIPCLAFFWPIKDEFKFLSEGLVYNDTPKFRWKQLPPAPISQGGEKFQEVYKFFRFIDLVIKYYNTKKPATELTKENLVRQSLNKIDPEKTTLYTAQHVRLKDPDNGNIKIAYRIETSKFIAKIKKLPELKGNYSNKLIKSKSFERFLSRPFSVVIEIDSDPTKGNRGFSDPYSGVVASFDYRYCREKTKGKKIRDRDHNLVFMPIHKNADRFFEKILNIQFKRTHNLKIKWQDRNTIQDTADITRELFATPSYTLKKELKNFFYFSDLIITKNNLFLGKSLI